MRGTGLACALSVLAAPAFANDYVVFASPSGNILCGIFLSDEGGADARCDIAEFTPTFVQPPKDCDLDWQGVFMIETDASSGRLGCVGDAIGEPTRAPLAYGQSVTYGDVTCSSARSGMTCMNSLGHGLTLSRNIQQVF
jgi:hypothetical protein